MKKLHFFLFIAVTLFITKSFAQDSKPLRVEIEAKKNSNSYNIVPLGKSGLIIFYQTDEKSEGNRIWEFTKYSTDLKEEWTKEVPVDKSNDLIKYFLSDSTGMLYLLTSNNKSMTANVELLSTKVSGTYQIVAFNILKGTYNTYSGEYPTIMAISDFKVIDNKASIFGISSPGYMDACAQSCLTFTCIPAITGFTVFKFKAYYINHDLISGTVTNSPLKLKGNTLFLGSQIIDDKTPFIKVLVRNKPNRKETYHYLYNYSATGSLSNKLKLKTTSGKNYTSAKYQKNDSAEAILIGTYSQSLKKGSFFNPASNANMGITNTSSGMYFSKFSGEKQDFIKYYPFTKFENFFNYLSDTYKTYLAKQKQKAKKKGKEIVVNYNLLVHDIIKKNDEYIMIAEAYYPEYHSECYTSYSGGKTTTTCKSVFDGYRYTHAVIAAFDSEGEMLWDNCFEIENILTYNLKERIKVMMDGDDIVLAYSYGGSVQSQIIQGSKVVQGKESTKIETSGEGDKVKKDWASDMSFWYGNYFLAWGYEKIKDQENKKRNVFYFNKIALE